MKFNIGDTVIGNSKATKRYVITQAGWTGTVTAIGPDRFFAQASKNGTNFQLRYEYFGLLKPVATTSKIVITSDGKTTLARLYDGNRVIRRAEAKCSPEDTYDFATGANLAYDRLMRPAKPTDPAKEPKPEPKPVKHLYSGKVVCVETHDDFTVGKVYTFKDGKVTDDSWSRRPMSNYSAESLDDWNSRCGDCIVRFVEYKGEAT